MPGHRSPSPPAGSGADRVALVLPTLNYLPDGPLLRIAGTVFRRHSLPPARLTVRDVRWRERPPPRDGKAWHVWFAELTAFVEARAAPALDRADAPRIALSGKSMGSLAGLAADRRAVTGVRAPAPPRSPRRGAGPAAAMRVPEAGGHRRASGGRPGGSGRPG